MIFRGGRIDGRVAPPPSKSRTHRAVLMASMADGESLIGNPSLCRDTMATADACRRMGASVEEAGGGLRILGGDLHAPVGTVDVGNSGTALRAVTAVCAMFGGESTITGDASARSRPMSPLLDALTEAGAVCTSDGGRAPVTVRGPLTADEVCVDGSVSSQFVTGLMMAAPLRDGGFTDIRILGDCVSRPYVDMTASMMRDFGVTAVRNDDGFTVPGCGYSPCDYVIPADYSLAAFPLAAGALGGRVTVTGMDSRDRRGDGAIVDILAFAGADVYADRDTVTVHRDKLEGCEVNMRDIPDLFPITAVLLSTAEGDSRLYGAPHLRHKESDRIAATVDMINSLGGSAEPTEDGCVIHGRPSLRGGRVDSRGDHRIMMSAAVASVVCEGPVEVPGTGCHSVSYPGFLEDMSSIGLEAE